MKHKIDLFDYIEYGNILPKGLQSPMINVKELKSNGFKPDNALPFKSFLLQVKFDIPSYITVYTRYPKSILEGLATIGGILAALKLLMAILLAFNKHWFLKELKNNQSKEEEMELAEDGKLK